MKLRLFLAVIVTSIFAACTPPSGVTKSSDKNEEPMEERTLETIEVVAPKVEKTYELSTYNPEYERTHDLLHTKLDLSFDWDNQYVIGQATLDFTPLFYASNTLRLDAKGMEIKEVAVKRGGSKTPLKYTYDNGMDLHIFLDKEYTRGEKYQLFIDYVAKPNERKTGGSAAITSDKGLFFINPKGEVKNKPKQIWTQGETEHNSAWFPTVDKPNERCTQEVNVTVADNFETLSNGVKTGSRKNSDGTRTDSYKLDQPHAPYLFMLAIGEFAIVKDSWRGKEVAYYVEKEYKDHARRIFPHTPEMMDFFSKKLIDYPWPKYNQVVVRDYVSGAMENTTAVIYGEFVQQTTRELIDNLQNERIVAHELIHHWFGDLVTCESWANLPMNESFANYGEYMWLEYKYGKDLADNHLRSEMGGYVGSSKRSIHPLIHFGYNDKEDMFDAHSYNKGGCILHMLRDYLGDEAFFEGLRKYLNDNAYTSVEAHDLRVAMEDVSGRDLNWFFNQWFFKAGHPVLDIAYGYDDVNKKATVEITQTQTADDVPGIFQLPIAIDLYHDGKVTRKNVWVKERKQMFSFDAPTKPDLIVADAKKVLLAEVTENHTDENWVFQLNNAKAFQSKYDAIRALKGNNTPLAQAAIQGAMNDGFHGIRRLAVNYLNKDNLTANILSKLQGMATTDKHSSVRAAAINLLSEAKDAGSLGVLKKVVAKEQSYPVLSQALTAINKVNPAEGLKLAAKMDKEENTSILSALGEIYASTGDLNYLPKLESMVPKMNGYAAMNFMKGYSDLLMKKDPLTIGNNLSMLKGVALDQDKSGWLRYACTNALNTVRKALMKTDNPSPQLVDVADGIKTHISEIAEKETSKQLRRIYTGFLK